MKINTTHRELPGVDFGLELGRDRGGGNEDGRKEGCNSEGGGELHCGVRWLVIELVVSCGSWCVADRPAMSCSRGVDEGRVKRSEDPACFASPFIHVSLGWLIWAGNLRSRLRVLGLNRVVFAGDTKHLEAMSSPDMNLLTVAFESQRLACQCARRPLN